MNVNSNYRNEKLQVVKRIHGVLLYPVSISIHINYLSLDKVILINETLT